MLDDTSLLSLYSSQYLRKDLSKASSPNQTENISSMSLNHMGWLRFVSLFLVI